MKSLDLESISKRIAEQILFEEFSTEKEKQQLVSRRVTTDDLSAPNKEKEDKEKLTDEADEEDEESEVEVEPKPVPGGDEGSTDEDDFEVEAVEQVPRDVSFELIKKQINNLRAGKSLKDPEVSAQLEDYYDKLGMAEERSLYVFLSSLGAILTGGTLGDEAPRPETMGVDINIRKEKASAEKSNAIPAMGAGGDQAPIIVGESANTMLYKIRLLEGLTDDDKHRCLNGKLTNFGSKQCMKDLTVRIADAVFNRDNCTHGSADRSSLNGILKYLRQKFRRANKFSALKQ